MRKIKKGDDVIVIAGKDKGKRGQVLTVRDDDRVVVQNINMIKRHTKGNPNRGVSGGIIEKEAPIHVSNVMLFNPAKGKGDRVGIKALENGKKVRQFKSNGENVDI
jgi:large subunit ribosomal protein L24